MILNATLEEQRKKSIKEEKPPTNQKHRQLPMQEPGLVVELALLRMDRQQGQHRQKHHCWFPMQLHLRPHHPPRRCRSRHRSAGLRHHQLWEVSGHSNGL